MAIKFIPPLNWTTRIPGGVPRAGNHDANNDGDAVRVQFTATMAERDYKEIQRADMCLELWTNAPAGRGEWRAFSFEEEDSRETFGCDDELEGDVLDLGGDDSATSEARFGTDLPSPSSPKPPATTSIATEISPRAHVFRVTLSLPPTPHQKYAFTYRIAKPSGIRWVGTDKTNGILHVVPQDGSILEQGEWTWVNSEGAGTEPAWLRSYATAEGAQGDFVIANLDLREKTWNGWGIARDGRSVHNFELPSTEDIPPSRFLYLIPKSTDRDSVHLPSPVALRALSWSSLISIRKSGAFVLHAQPDAGRSVVERRVHDIDSTAAFRRLRSEVVSSIPAPQILSISKDEKNDVIVFTPSHDSEGATTLYAQSLHHQKTTRISVPLSALEAFAPETSSSVALFNPRTKDCVFVDQSSSAPITLLPRQETTEFAVIPVYDINDDPRAKWQIGLTSVTTVPELITVKTLNPLPTPPDSPRPKPRQSVSFVLPVEEQSRQEDEPESMSSISNENTDQISSSNEDVPLPSPSSDAPGATSLALFSKAQQSLVHRAQILLGDGRVFATFSIFAWIVGAFIRRMFRTFLPLGLQSRLDGLVWYLLPFTIGSSHTSGRKRIEGQRTTMREINGGTPRLNEISGGASARSESANGNESARSVEETSTHLFIDPVPLTASPSTIESGDPIPSSPPSYMPSRTESTKAARWDIPAADDHHHRGGGPRAGAADSSTHSTSTLHLLVRKPLVSGGAAAPHEALYVEVDGTECPLGPDLLRRVSQGWGALSHKTKEAATISDDPTAPSTSPSEAACCSVFAIEVPPKKSTSVLVRLRA